MDKPTIGTQAEFDAFARGEETQEGTGKLKAWWQRKRENARLIVRILASGKGPGGRD